MSVRILPEAPDGHLLSWPRVLGQTEAGAFEQAVRRTQLLLTAHLLGPLGLGADRALPMVRATVADALGKVSQTRGGEPPLARLAGTGQILLRKRVRAELGNQAGLDVDYEPTPESTVDVLRAHYAGDAAVTERVAAQHGLLPFLELTDAAVRSLPAAARAVLNGQSSSDAARRSLADVGGALLLAELRPGRCDGLGELLRATDWRSGEPFWASLRPRVLAHVAGCGECGVNQRRATERFAALPGVLVPAVLGLGEQRRELLVALTTFRSGAVHAIEERFGAATGGSATGEPTGTAPVAAADVGPAAWEPAGTAPAGPGTPEWEPPPSPGWARDRRALLAVAVAVLVVTGVVVGLTARGGGPTAPPAASGAPAANGIGAPAPSGIGDVLTPTLPTIAPPSHGAPPTDRPSGRPTASHPPASAPGTPGAPGAPGAPAAGGPTATASVPPPSSAPPTSGQLVIVLAPGSTGDLDLHVGTVDVDNCTRGEDPCTARVRAGDVVRLDPEDRVAGWPAPCAGTDPHADCVFTATGGLTMTVLVRADT
jgi:hypothetical protein